MASYGRVLGGVYRTTTGTTVVVRESEEGGFSEMDIITTDRPGLLTDIVKVLKDINVNVISAEVGGSKCYSISPCVQGQRQLCGAHQACVARLAGCFALPRNYRVAMPSCWLINCA